MKFYIFGILLFHATIANTCLEPAATTVHIQNHEGPIYVSPGENRLPTLCNPISTCDNRYPTISNLATTCDNRYPTISNPPTTCDNRYPTISNPASTTINCYPTLPTRPSTCDQTPQILHSSNVPYHQSVCETDCKCVTKHQTVIPVAVNSVPQNSGTPGYSQYPEGCYGYVCPDGYTLCSESDTSSCPRISETLIPLLKTYLTQGSASNNCQCGRKHSQYYS